MNSPQRVGHAHQVLPDNEAGPLGASFTVPWGHSQRLHNQQEAVLGPNPRPGPTRADLREMSSQELSGLMRITPSHSGIRTVFLKEVIWPVFPAKRNSSRPLMGEGKFGLRNEPQRPDFRQTAHASPPGFLLTIRTPSCLLMPTGHCSHRRSRKSAVIKSQ